LKRIILFILIIVVISVGVLGCRYYKMYAGANVPKTLPDPYVHIPSGSSFQDVVNILYEGQFIKDTVGFKLVADRLEYIRDPMRAGRFKIDPKWSNLDLVRHLRGGKQATVKVVLTTERLPENVAAKAARFIEPDSVQLMEVFQNESILAELGVNKETLMSLFIPNTYDFFWTTGSKRFLERMAEEHKAFWSKNGRMEKAKKLNMSPEEVYTLASIVEKETNQNSEKKRMAGVYLNRLKKGMLLQADPTSVFATRDFTTKRVTDYHTNFDSPYNTYKYKGLPPGPIAMASIASIDAVLNAEDHDYIFFCAKGDGTGLHSFAKTLSAHNKNARIYRENLRKRGLR
jgi:UPF0755 protein